MDATQWFTDERRDELATPSSIRLERAARRRDAEEARAVAAEVEQECIAVYGHRWVGILQSSIVEEAGELAHDEALHYAMEYAFRPFVRAFRGLSFRQHVALLAERLRASGSTFWVVDEGSRLRFRLDPWGPVRQWRRPETWQASAPRHRVGDRYVYPSLGAYDGPDALVTLTGPRPLLQGRPSLPCFLATEIAFLEILAIEELGAPIAVATLPIEPDQPAFLDVYRDPRDVPAEAYRRVATVKPAHLPSRPGVDASFRPDELERLAVPLSLRIEDAADRRAWDELLELVERMDAELVTTKDVLSLLRTGLLTWIARHLGEAAVERVLLRSAAIIMEPWLARADARDPVETIELWAMVWRAHGSTFTIEEDDETVTMRGTMGACGRLWAPAGRSHVERAGAGRIRYPTFGAYDPPAGFHRLREPRPMTHGQPGYPIYSAHCHVFHEIYPIDRIGRPLWVERHPLDDPAGDTVHVHHKDPSAWPAEAYALVGR